MSLNFSERFFHAGDGERIFYARAGRDRPLVFLHGWTANHTEWLYFASRLAERADAICWDARGHGGHSPLTVNPPRVERMARDLRDLIGHLGLERPVLLGHSMGVLTVWEYIRRYGTGGLGGLVLVDQSPRLLTGPDWTLGIYGDFDAGANRRFIGQLRQDLPEAVLRLAAFGRNARARERYLEDSGGFRRQRDYLRSLAPGPLIHCWESLTAADYRAVLPAITVPTLLVYGAESNFYGPETVRYVHENIPGSWLRVYQRADHSPHLWHRERFVADVAQLLDEVAGRE